MAASFAYHRPEPLRKGHEYLQLAREFHKGGDDKAALRALMGGLEAILGHADYHEKERQKEAYAQLRAVLPVPEAVLSEMIPEGADAWIADLLGIERETVRLLRKRLGLVGRRRGGSASVRTQERSEFMRKWAPVAERYKGA